MQFCQEEGKIKRETAKSLHEAFVLLGDEDDFSVFKEIFIDFISENSKKMCKIMNQNLATFIINYNKGQEEVTTPKSKTSEDKQII